MSTIFWIAVILTSPFWMILGIIMCFYIFVICVVIVALITEVINEFLNLFRRNK